MDTIKTEADQLLFESEVPLTLKKYGTVEFAGSYSLDLMVSRDIDIYVITPEANKQLAVKALNELITQSFFNGYLYYDFINFSREGFPKGNYVGLKTKYKGSKWKIDIWFLEKDLPERKLLIETISALSSDAKKKIKAFKSYIIESNLKIPSINVYNAVIKNPQISLDAFEKEFEINR